MNVTLSTKGRFQAFNLAYELQRHGHLCRLLTSLPRSQAAKYGIAPESTRSVVLVEIFDRIWTRLPRTVTRFYSPQYDLCEAYDSWASTRIPTDTQIFVGWSSFALRSMRVAKTWGARTVIERGSSHMLYQRRILSEEFARFGITLPIDVKVEEKALREYEEADYISIPSSYVRDTFLEFGIPQAKLIQVPYGVNLEQFTAAPKPDDVFRVLFCGGLTIRKGVHYLLQAFSELRLKNAELLLVGTLSDEIVPFLARYRADNIVHEHPVPFDQLPKIYSRASVFCLPSLEEGLALVQAQAMACGLPVICSENTGGRDIVRDGIDGYVVPIRDVNALKERILYFFDNPAKCAELGASARERVRSGFSWADYGENMIASYRRILGLETRSS